MESFDQFANEYKSLLDESLKIGGESGDYFSRYKADLICRRIGKDFNGTILDYGCGVGLLSADLAKVFPNVRIDGFDISAASIEHVPASLKERGRFTADGHLLDPCYDIIILANVLHHTELNERQGLIASLNQRLKPGGRLFIFEHNPYNPITCKVVRESPLDKGVILLPSNEIVSYLQKASFVHLRLDYIVFFPKFLSFLRRFEPYLGWLPLGAQQVVEGSKSC